MVLPCLGYFPLLDSYWLDYFSLLPLVNYRRLPWSTLACVSSTLRSPYRYRYPVPGLVRHLFSHCSPPIGWIIFTPAPIGCRLPWSTPVCAQSTPRPPVRRYSSLWFCPTFVFSPTRLLLVGQYLPLLPLVNYCRLPWSTPACA
jgi:hypothetical protein